MIINLFTSLSYGKGWLNQKSQCIIIASFSTQILDNWFINLPPIKRGVKKLKIMMRVSWSTQG